VYFPRINNILPHTTCLYLLTFYLRAVDVYYVMCNINTIIYGSNILYVLMANNGNNILHYLSTPTFLPPAHTPPPPHYASHTHTSHALFPRLPPPPTLPSYLPYTHLPYTPHSTPYLLPPLHFGCGAFSSYSGVNIGIMVGGILGEFRLGGGRLVILLHWEATRLPATTCLPPPDGHDGGLQVQATPPRHYTPTTLRPPAPTLPPYLHPTTNTTPCPYLPRFCVPDEWDVMTQ